MQTYGITDKLTGYTLDEIKRLAHNIYIKTIVTNHLQPYSGYMESIMNVTIASYSETVFKNTKFITATDAIEILRSVDVELQIAVQQFALEYNIAHL